MFRAGKEQGNWKPQGRGGRDAGQAWGALPEGMGKSTAELHPPPPDRNSLKFPSKQELLLACGLCS